MSADRTLIREATVVTMEPGEPDRVADILIEGETIAAIGPGLNVTDGATAAVDATNRIVVPGFIDTHRHLYQVLFRGLGSDWSLFQYLAAIIGTIGPHVTAENLFVANRLGALDALDSGVTAVFDWSQHQLTPEHTDALVDALDSAHIRATFGAGARVTDLLECLSPPFRSTVPTPDSEVRRLREGRFSCDSGLLTLGLAARGPDIATMDVVRSDWALARELGIRINIHIGQGVFPGPSSVMALHEANLLGSDLIFGHCNLLSDQEIALMADHGVTATVTPEDECCMGHGWPAIGRLIRAGVWPNIGIDTCIAVGGDQFTAMRFALAMPRAQDNQVALEAGENPQTLHFTVRDALRMATIEGARALGQEDRIGSLAVGKQADLICIDTADVSMTPVIDPVASVVHHASRSVVTDVFVAGRRVKKDGVLVDIDAAALHREATEATAGILERAGIAAGWSPPAH